MTFSRTSGTISRLILCLCICASMFSSVHAQRISILNNKFVVGGSQIFILGANTPWNSWNDFGGSFSPSWWNTHFSTMHNNGLNATRVWITCNGANSSPGIDANGLVSSPTQAFWTNVDSLFSIARKNQIYLMIALISFDHVKTGNTNADRWVKMFASATNRASFVDNYAVPFVQRYNANPYFFSIDVGNELDWAYENYGVTHNNLFDLVARVANGVHANSQVLVTLGTGAGPKYCSTVYIDGNWYSDASLQALQSGAYLDFYNDHFYEWMTPYFSTPFDKSPADWGISEKPCLIGEYAASGAGGYTPQQCLDKAYSLGWQGVMPWTSNGVDGCGSLSNFGTVFSTFRAAHPSLFPSATAQRMPQKVQHQATGKAEIMMFDILGRIVKPSSLQRQHGMAVTIVRSKETCRRILEIDR